MSTGQWRLPPTGASSRPRTSPAGVLGASPTDATGVMAVGLLLQRPEFFDTLFALLDAEPSLARA
eukprot:2972619-Prymnesium_polylepis.1